VTKRGFHGFGVSQHSQIFSFKMEGETLDFETNVQNTIYAKESAFMKNDFDDMSCHKRKELVILKDGKEENEKSDQAYEVKEEPISDEKCNLNNIYNDLAYFKRVYQLKNYFKN
jgi:hypothetical protein